MINWKVAISIIFTIDFKNIIIYFLLITLTFIIGLYKYKIIIRQKFNWIETGYIYFVSKLGANITPAGLGDIAPLLENKFRKKEVALTILLDKIIVFYFLLLFGFIGLIFEKNLPDNIIILLSLLFVIISICLFMLKANNLWVRLRNWLHSKRTKKLKGFFEKNYTIILKIISLIEKISFEINKIKYLYGYLFFLTFISLILTTLASQLMFTTFNINISIFLILELITLSGLIRVFSFIPMGLGITEVSLLMILDQYQVNRAAFASYVIITRTTGLLILFLLYIVFFLLYKKQTRIHT